MARNLSLGVTTTFLFLMSKAIVSLAYCDCAGNYCESDKDCFGGCTCEPGLSCVCPTPPPYTPPPATPVPPPTPAPTYAPIPGTVGCPGNSCAQNGTNTTSCVTWEYYNGNQCAGGCYAASYTPCGCCETQTTLHCPAFTPEAPLDTDDFLNTSALTFITSDKFNWTADLKSSEVHGAKYCCRTTNQPTANLSACPQAGYNLPGRECKSQFNETIKKDIYKRVCSAAGGYWSGGNDNIGDAGDSSGSSSSSLFYNCQVRNDCICGCMKSNWVHDVERAIYDGMEPAPACRFWAQFFCENEIFSWLSYLNKQYSDCSSRPSCQPLPPPPTRAPYTPSSSCGQPCDGGGCSGTCDVCYQNNGGKPGTCGP